MNKKIMLFIIIAALISVFVLAISNLTEEQRGFYNSCKRNCSTDKMLDKKQCNDDASGCNRLCATELTNKTLEYQAQYRNCTDECGFKIAANLTKKEVNQITRMCRKNCTLELQETRTAAFSNHRACRGTCQDAKNDCKKEANEVELLCRDNCTYAASKYIGNKTNRDNETDNHNETQHNDTENNTTIAKIFCVSVRPTTCTNEYAPVCSNTEKVYSNGCVACQNRNVKWYTPGLCSH